MASQEVQRSIETVYRIERTRLIAGLARLTRSVDLAEELAQDALLIALSDGRGPGFRVIPAPG